MRYYFTSNILLDELFDGRMEQAGLTEKIDPERTTPQCRCLTDGFTETWVTSNKNGFVKEFKEVEVVEVCPRVNSISAIQKQFGGHCYGDHEASPSILSYGDGLRDSHIEERFPEYKKIWEQLFYEKMIEYVKDEVDATWEEVGLFERARFLISRDPELALPERKQELLGQVYDHKRW